MTDAEINVAVAEACGWRWYRRPATGPWAKKLMRSLYHPELMKLQDERWQLALADMSETPCNYVFIMREGSIPDYVHDLNAMHEAWMVLNTVERAKFAEELAYVVLAVYNDPNTEFVFSRCSLAVFANANSKERSEAFLRVKGLWK